MVPLNSSLRSEWILDCLIRNLHHLPSVYLRLRIQCRYTQNLSSLMQFHPIRARFQHTHQLALWWGYISLRAHMLDAQFWLWVKQEHAHLWSICPRKQHFLLCWNMSRSLARVQTDQTLVRRLNPIYWLAVLHNFHQILFNQSLKHLWINLFCYISWVISQNSRYQSWVVLPWDLLFHHKTKW